VQTAAGANAGEPYAGDPDRVMNAMVLAYFVAVLLMLKATADVGQRQAYACPVCGTKRQEEHAPDCPWQRPHPS
jgi:hypothetical protein